MDIETVYQKYFHEVFLYLRAISGSESIAEELTQETFVRAMKGIGKFDENRAAKSWILAIARNTYFRYCRRNRIYSEEELPDELFDPALQILERMIDKEAAKAIKNHMEHLPEPYGIIM